MKPFRAKRRPGNRAPTKAEAARMRDAKESPCAACLRWAQLGNMPYEDVAVCCDYNHAKSGNVRRGHRWGFPGCGWHHRGLVGDGWTHASMRAHFGPSLMDGSRLFHATYGSDDELIALHDSRERALGAADALMGVFGYRRVTA